MEEQEAGAAARRVAVTSVEPFDGGGGGGQQLVVASGHLGWRVEPVGQQGEAKVTIEVGQVVDLEPGDLLFDVGHAGQEGRHDDQRPQLGRHAVGQIEPRQRTSGQAGWSPHD